MQSKNEDKDQELAERVNELIRDPEANMNATSEMDESASHAELMRLLNGVENQGTRYICPDFMLAFRLTCMIDPSITPENLLQFLNSMNG